MEQCLDAAQPDTIGGRVSWLEGGCWGLMLGPQRDELSFQRPTHLTR